jgi:hypothetical protein
LDGPISSPSIFWPETLVMISKWLRCSGHFQQPPTTIPVFPSECPYNQHNQHSTTCNDWFEQRSRRRVLPEFGTVEHQLSRCIALQEDHFGTEKEPSLNVITALIRPM